MKSKSEEIEQYKAFLGTLESDGYLANLLADTQESFEASIKNDVFFPTYHDIRQAKLELAQEKIALKQEMELLKEQKMHMEQEIARLKTQKEYLIDGIDTLCNQFDTVKSILTKYK